MASDSHRSTMSQALEKRTSGLSKGSVGVGIALASGRVSHRLSEDARRASPVLGMHRSRVSECDIPGDCVGELDSDMRDLARLFEVSDRPQGLASAERFIAAIELVGGDGRGYRREHAKAARAIIAEVYSPPRVTAAAGRLPKYGLQPGLALDITVNDETGQPYDFSIKDQRTKAELLIEEQQPMLLIGSPMCTAFSAIQAINSIPGKRDPLIVAREKAAGRLHLDWC